MLEEATEHRVHPDVLREPGHAGAQGADAAHPDVDLDAGTRGAIEPVNDPLVDDRVDLEADVARARLGPLGLDLPADPLEQTGPRRPGRDQQALEAAARGQAGELVEEAGQVGADLLVVGQQPEVLIETCGLGVVVAGADVAVAAQTLFLLTDDEGKLAVGLEPDDAVDDVDAGALEFAGPADVVDLVEAGLDLDDRQHLLARLGGVDEGVDDRAVTRRAIEGLLDRQHARVGGRLLDEGLHRRRERVIGVLQQHVLLADAGKDVARLGRLGRGQVGVGARDERREVQVRALQIGDDVEGAQVQRCRQAIDLGRVDAQLAHDEVEHVVVDLVVDLEPHRRPEPPPRQFLLQCGQEVLGVVLLDLDVLIAGDAEGEVLAHLHPGEELLQMGRDHVLQRDKTRVIGVERGVRGGHFDAHEPRQQRRHLDSREVLLAGLGVDQDDGEVEREPGDVGEGVGRVDGQRRQHREELVAEDLAQVLLLGRRQLVPADDGDALLLQRRSDLLVIDPGLHVEQLVRDIGELVDHLARLQPGGAAHGDAGRDAALEPGHPDHEELVEVAREDREITDALEQRDVGVGRQLQDPLVELQPRDLAVEEAVRGQAVLVRPVHPGRDDPHEATVRRARRRRPVAHGGGAHGRHRGHDRGVRHVRSGGHRARGRGHGSHLAPAAWSRSPGGQREVPGTAYIASIATEVKPSLR